MRSITLGLLMICFYAPVYGQEAKPNRAYQFSRVVLYSGHIADLASTEVFLARGYKEANPLLQNRAERIAISTTATLAFDLMSGYIARNGHPRLAKIMNFASGGGRIAVALAWNLNTKENK